jgi:hypothetical protein
MTASKGARTQGGQEPPPDWSDVDYAVVDETLVGRIYLFGAKGAGAFVCLLAQLPARSAELPQLGTPRRGQSWPPSGCASYPQSYPQHLQGACRGRTRGYVTNPTQQANAGRCVAVSVVDVERHEERYTSY